MSKRSKAAFEIWHARSGGAIGDWPYVGYAVLMIALVVVVPLGRAVWLSATSAAGIALFQSPAAPGLTALIVAAIWAGALLLGRERGPALFPPLLTYALASSDLPRSEAFRRPVLRIGLLLPALTTITTGLVGGSLASHDLVGLFSVGLFTAAGALVGLITSVAWLAGQALPRAAVPVAIGLLVLGALTAAVPALQIVVPWGWVALTYPGIGSPRMLALLAALGASLVAVVPVLLNRLELAQLLAHAARWESATTRAAGLEFSDAAAAYQVRPYFGRRIRAVRSSRVLPLTFWFRDAVGAFRTPGRFIVGVFLLASAGVLVTLAFAPAAPGWLLGATAGVLLFAGSGPITDGVRHAASVSSDFPFYGISDERLFGAHALFPLTVVVIALSLAVVVSSIVAGITAVAPLISSLALGLIVLLLRVGNALKGALPPALLTPVPTPMGDFGAAIRMAWAVDGLLLAALAGAATVHAFEHPILVGGVAVVAVTLVINRWRHRR